jgi:hypothetical protein
VENGDSVERLKTQAVPDKRAGRLTDRCGKREEMRDENTGFFFATTFGMAMPTAM